MVEQDKQKRSLSKARAFGTTFTNQSRSCVDCLTIGDHFCGNGGGTLSLDLVKDVSHFAWFRKETQKEVNRNWHLPGVERWHNGAGRCSGSGKQIGITLRGPLVPNGYHEGDDNMLLCSRCVISN